MLRRCFSDDRQSVQFSGDCRQGNSSAGTAFTSSVSRTFRALLSSSVTSSPASGVRSRMRFLSGRIFKKYLAAPQAPIATSFLRTGVGKRGQSVILFHQVFFRISEVITSTMIASNMDFCSRITM